MPDKTTASQPSAGVKLLIEVGPLVVFFVANAKWDIFVGTGAFMVAITLSLLASWLTERRLPTLPLVTAFFVLVFGTLTLVLKDATFIKLKPTLVYSLFGILLLVGLALRRSWLEPLLGTALSLTEEGWRRLTLRWALFFLVMAVVNEVVWRNFSDDVWVNFKVFGFLPLTLVFFMAQTGLLRRHSIEEEGRADGG